MTRIKDFFTRQWALLVLTLWGLPLTGPLWSWTAVTCSHDGHLHYHRVAAMRHAWENGLYFSRWLPDLAFGYGYPFFVYREPTPLYAVLFPHMLGLSLPAASNLFYALCILAAGWFMFLWVRDILGAPAALMAGAAYMAAPYMLIDAFIRGNSPESLALPLFPLLLWSGRRWLLQGGRAPFLITVLGLAFLSLSHNISTLIFTPTLLVYLLLLGLLHRLPWRTSLLRSGLLFGLGLGMTIFYTGGALLEMGSVTLQQSTNTRNNDFRFNFASWGEILAPAAAEDPLLLNPPLLIRLGWVPLALALAGLLLWLWQRRRGQDERERDWHVWMMVAATAVYLFFALPLSSPLWETVPLIDFVQFPWRFAGRAALPLAFLAGLPFAFLPVLADRRWWQDALLPLALLLMIGSALPALYPAICREEPFPTILTVHDYERGTNLVGVDPEGSYFPRTVQRRPDGSPLEADYRAGRTPQRFDRRGLPAALAWSAESYSPLGGSAVVDTPAPVMLQYLTFAFPGWTATVNGETVPITPSEPGGLITFPVPAGVHEVEVRWQTTPLRTLLTTLSLLSVAGVGVVTLVLGQNPGRKRMTGKSGPRVPVRGKWLLAAAALLLLGSKLLVIDRVESPLRRAAGPDPAVALQIRGAELQLWGYSLSAPAAPAGGTVDIDMAWSAIASPTADYQTNVWLEGPEGAVWSEKETYRPRLYEDVPRTIFWQPGQWAWDSREMQIFAGTPPGEYDIVLTLFDLESLQPVTLQDGAGNVLGPTTVIGRLTVTAPETEPAATPQFGVGTAVAAVDAELIGFNQDRQEAAPGDPLLLTLFWERLGRGGADTVTLELQDAAGSPVRSWELRLAREDFSLAEWQPDQLLRGQHLLRLPAALETGVYRFVLDGDVELGNVQIDAPPRLLEPPPVAIAAAQLFSHAGETVAELVGVTLTPHQGSLGVELVWRGAAEMETSYRVFVHLVDETGMIRAQSDAEPAAWTRPTTGWLPGEYIIDMHQLVVDGDIAPGWELRIGLVDPQNGVRLQAGDAAFWSIPLP